MSDGTTATSTVKFHPAAGDQAIAFPAGDHAGMRALVRGLSAEPAAVGRNDGLTWCGC